MKAARAMLTVAFLLLVAAPLAAEAQRAKRYHIGVLSPTNGRNPFDDSLEKHLSDFGWVNAKNVTFSYRYSGVNDALPALAKELVREEWTSSSRRAHQRAWRRETRRLRSR